MLTVQPRARRSYDSDIKARLTRIEDVLATLITRLPAPSPPEETPDHHAQTSSSSRHAARVISSPRPIAPAPPGITGGQSNRNRIRNHHHLARRGSSASADLGGSTSHAALQLDHHHRHPVGVHSGQQHGVVGGYDVRATLGTGMEGIMQNNGSEEVFHPKGSGLSNVGYPTYQVRLVCSGCLPPSDVSLSFANTRRLNSLVRALDRVILNTPHPFLSTFPPPIPTLPQQTIHPPTLGPDPSSSPV